MTNIIDRRHKKHSSSKNRQKFMERYKDTIQERVNTRGSWKSIKGFNKKEKINIRDTKEPSFRHRNNSGVKHIVAPGNDETVKGDLIGKPQSTDGTGKGAGSGGEDSVDEFAFTLSREEFLNYYFSDMELPKFIKESLTLSKDKIRKRAGYTKIGIPARLSLKKTMENAIARRVAAKNQGKKPRYLDDTDLRYNHFKWEAIPRKQAVMFCVMDVSGSMGEREKTIAKKFFLLLYLFLEKNYDDVVLHFVTYTDTALEVSETEFFYGQRTGGTAISPALDLCSKLIEEKYRATNVYMAHVSDGDNFHDDHNKVCMALDKILSLVQYYVYLYVPYSEKSRPAEYYTEVEKRKSKNCNCAKVASAADVYPALRELFKKEGE